MKLKASGDDLDEDVLTGMFKHLHTEGEVPELDPRLCFAPYGIDEDWYASTLRRLSTRVLSDLSWFASESSS
jgi:hypothetical protein